MPKKAPKSSANSSVPSDVNADELDSNWISAPLEPVDVAASEAPISKVKSKKRKLTKEGSSKSDKKPKPTVSTTPKTKKKRKKWVDKDESKKLPDSTVGPSVLCEWSAARLASAWVAEAKATKLAPLEARDIAPAAAWFAACSPDSRLTRVPWQLSGDDGDVSSLQALRIIRDGGTLPTPSPKNVSVAVLCVSAERAFAAQQEVRETWKVRPMVLAAHGGGRKSDQIARNAKALESGLAVALATPSRLLRLIDESHLDVSSLETLIIDLARDRKNYDVLSLADLRRDVFSLIRQHLLPSINSGKLRIVFCSGDVAVSAGSGLGEKSVSPVKVKRGKRKTKQAGSPKAVSAKKRVEKRKAKTEQAGSPKAVSVSKRVKKRKAKTE